MATSCHMVIIGVSVMSILRQEIVLKCFELYSYLTEKVTHSRKHGNVESIGIFTEK